MYFKRYANVQYNYGNKYKSCFNLLEFFYFYHLTTFLKIYKFIQLADCL